jgi:arylsulfatase A-like enzyme
MQSVHAPWNPPEYYLSRAKEVGEEHRRKRAAMVAVMDEGIGNITRYLKNTYPEMYRDTVVIFVSDNGADGGGSNWPLRGGKMTLYEGGTRVLSAMRIPVQYLSTNLTQWENMKQRSGTHEYSHLMHMVDIFPTIMELVDGRLTHFNDFHESRFSMQHKLDGISHLSSFKQFFAGSNPTPPRDIMFYGNNNRGQAFFGSRIGVRKGGYKLIVDSTLCNARSMNYSNFELFNLNIDASELNNLAQGLKTNPGYSYSTIVNELEQLLLDMYGKQKQKETEIPQFDPPKQAFLYPMETIDFSSSQKQWKTEFEKHYFNTSQTEVKCLLPWQSLFQDHLNTSISEIYRIILQN